MHGYSQQLFQPESDQLQIFPVASPVLIHHTLSVLTYAAFRFNPLTPELKKYILPTF